MSVREGDRFKNKHGVELVVVKTTPNGGAFMEWMGQSAGHYSERELKKLARVTPEERKPTEAEELLAKLNP